VGDIAGQGTEIALGWKSWRDYNPTQTLVAGLTGAAISVAAKALGQVLANCFPAGTLVATEAGPRAIEAVRKDDQVWAYDLVASCWCLCRVLQTFNSHHDGSRAFVTVAGETIEATYRHPFWVVRGEALAERPRLEHLPKETTGATTEGRWVDAGDLRVGDELLLRDGRVAWVESLRLAAFAGEVYNFYVEGLNCYAVGRKGVLVHNFNGAPEGAAGRGWRGSSNIEKEALLEEISISERTEESLTAWENTETGDAFRDELATRIYRNKNVAEVVTGEDVPALDTPLGARKFDIRVTLHDGRVIYIEAKAAGAQVNLLQQWKATWLAANQGIVSTVVRQKL
jgi:hypothetical protein